MAKDILKIKRENLLKNNINSQVSLHLVWLVASLCNKMVTIFWQGQHLSKENVIQEKLSIIVFTYFSVDCPQQNLSPLVVNHQLSKVTVS